MSNRRPVMPVLLDTDGGIDDVLALCLAFQASGCRVEALTTVAGNVPVEVATRNVARVLAAARPISLPVVGVGAAAPRNRPLVTAVEHHGVDGIGGLSAIIEADGRPRFPEAPLAPHPGGAVDVILDAARRRPGELVVVTLGPLTNVAEAVDRDVDTLRRLRAIVVMGGAIAVGGNVTAAAEYNVFVDPESAARVLGATLPLTLVPLDVTRQVVWSTEAVERIRRAPDPLLRLATAVARRGLELSAGRGTASLVLHDPLAVGVALDPTLVDTEELWVGVETEGTLTRGLTVADRRSSARDRSRPNCRVALRVRAGRFLRMFEEGLCHGFA